jgi:hypothetical protein
MASFFMLDKIRDKLFRGKSCMIEQGVEAADGPPVTSIVCNEGSRAVTRHREIMIGYVRIAFNINKSRCKVSAVGRRRVEGINKFRIFTDELSRTD